MLHPPIQNRTEHRKLRDQIERSIVPRQVPGISAVKIDAGQAIAGPFSAAVGVRTAIVAAGLLMSVPNLCVLAFVREVRQVRRAPRSDPALVP